MIKIPFFAQNKHKDKYYAGLLLKEDSGKVFLLKIDATNRLVRVVDSRYFSYTNAWENIIEDVDDTLFTLEKKHNATAKKVILFLYSHLIDSGSKAIRQPYLTIVKKLLKEMNLEPLGYMEHHEAIEATLSQREKVGLSAVLIELDELSISVFVYKNGKLFFNDSRSRTEDVMPDLEDIIVEAHNKGVLPMRIILYDSGGNDDMATKIIANKWPDECFVQLPKVEILQRDELDDALIYSFQQQLFGTTNFSIEKGLHDRSNDTSVQSKTSGFLVGGDIAEQETKEINNDEYLSQKVAKKDTFSVSDSSSSKHKQFFSVIISFFSNLSLPKLSRNPAILLVFAGLVLIISALVGYLYAFHKADILITYDVDLIEKEISLSRGLKVEKKQKKITTEEKISTTGTTSVGEKSKGNVNLYNTQKNSVNLEKGTIIISSDQKEYVLDNDAFIASASQKTTIEGDVLIVTGKNSASFTASIIGPEYNQKKDTNFTVKGYDGSQVYATSSDVVSGGTKKEVKIVSRDDIESINTLVTKSIMSKKTLEVNSGKSDEKIIPPLTQVVKTNNTYSAEAGEEASELLVKSIADIEYYTYDHDGLVETLVKTLSKSLPDNTTLLDTGVSYSIKEAEIDDKGVVSAIILVKATPKPNVEVESIKRQIRWMSFTQLDSVIKKDYKARDYDVAISGIYPIKTRIPFFTSRITVTISTRGNNE